MSALVSLVCDPVDSLDASLEPDALEEGETPAFPFRCSWRAEDERPRDLIVHARSYHDARRAVKDAAILNGIGILPSTLVVQQLRPPRAKPGTYRVTLVHVQRRKIDVEIRANDLEDARAKARQIREDAHFQGLWVELEDSIAVGLTNLSQEEEA
jgi:hypothetical protein